jgi:hypothetical protein
MLLGRPTLTLLIAVQLARLLPRVPALGDVLALVAAARVYWALAGAPRRMATLVRRSG